MCPVTLKQGYQSQMDGGPNEKFSYKPRAGLIKCSLKLYKMATYSVVNRIKPTENLTSILQYDRKNRAIFFFLGAIENPLAGLDSGICGLDDWMRPSQSVVILETEY